ncbi:hypothetical protein [Paenibacillus gansuensis]|uniref:Lipoprotein n=1 Tax=Paenibacillus gansuensis TaxID=306542 RepID=A0ABW5P7W8_9BACL
MKRKDAMKLSMHMMMVGVLAVSLAACSKEPAASPPADTANEQNQQNQGNQQNQQNEPAPEPSTPSETKSDPVSAKGTFNGAIDNHTIEIDMDGVPQAFQLDESVQDTVKKLKEKESVEYQYYELTTKMEDGTEVKQLVITQITQSNASADTGVKKPLPAAKEITMELEGMKETHTGKLAESASGYFMYTLPGYTLTSEEPGRDLLYPVKNDTYFTRIEQLGDQPDFTVIRKNAEEELSELGNVQEMRTENLTEAAKDSKFFLHAGDAKLTKNVFVLPVDGQWFKFTMNIPQGEAGEGVGPSVWAMIGTMQLK